MLPLQPARKGRVEIKTKVDPFAAIRECYGVPAEKGGRVRYSGAVDKIAKDGTIVAARGLHLVVRLDGDAFDKTLNPVWEIEYLPKVAKGSKREGRKA